MVILRLQIKLNIGNTEYKRLELNTYHVEPDLSLFPNALNDPSFLMYVSCLWYPEITYNNVITSSKEYLRCTQLRSAKTPCS